MAKFTWTQENTSTLVSAVDGVETVAQDQLITLAETLGTTPRSVGAKLRKMDYSVAKAVAKTSAWTEAQEVDLSDLVNANAGNLTYAEIAASFEAGTFTAKQVQGKLLSMELFDKVKKAERKTAPRSYTPDEEVKFVALVQGGATMEDLAEAFNKPIASVRGKALSLTRSGEIEGMPKQASSNAKEQKDVFEGIDIEGSTVAEIAEVTGRTVRGIKSTLSRRGISASDYNGAGRREKLDAKAE
jgi:hypothetical protein